MMELRSDGRKNDELRKIKGRMNVLKGCDGSAVFQLGNTKVLAVVYGPSDIQEWRLNYSELQDDLYVKCNLSVSSSTKMSRGQPYCNSLFCLILECDGGELSCCINATTLAFLDAGIPIRNIVVSCTAALIFKRTTNDLVSEATHKMLVDVNNSELSFSNRPACITVTHSGNSPSALMWNLDRGKIHSTLLPGLFDLASKGCLHMSQYINTFCRHNFN
ncbi:Exosome complex component RRP41 [Thelohanellus kitauei]|uniref:Exosome complex component RRP41 n=1 Tax=Thelohanellus kitauei TaxID=669202 RepID=A0A0C2MBU5_THEKT|nr:Exosome complex component RRP41 [Thelohanellus kitauei]